MIEERRGGEELRVFGLQDDLGTGRAGRLDGETREGRSNRDPKALRPHERRILAWRPAPLCPAWPSA